MCKLTPREQQTYALLILGCTRREIALQLGVSPLTIKNFAGQVYKKSNSYDQLDLIFNHYNLPRWKPDETPQT